jgi:hypothetical protein
MLGHDKSKPCCCVQEFMGIVDEVGEDVHSVKRWVRAWGAVIKP